MPSRRKTVTGGFAEVHPPLSHDEAHVEAARCLYCFDAPCTRACPTHIDIPRFIRQILHRDTSGAARTILDANIFGGSCARVCPTQVLCEGACVDNTHLNLPVSIGRLQRYACDDAHEDSMHFYETGAETGRRVAIVGAGPAGLTCAHELRKRGHAVSVFEARNVAGGLNTLGIAAYKITTEFALSEVERVRRLGIDLRMKQRINGARLAKLLKEFDAVFLAVGLGRTQRLGIPGEDLPGVWEALEFLFQTHTKPPSKWKFGKCVIVIGGGNTAIDVANAAVRMGAERVTVAYRRDQASMPAFAHEYELAVESGVNFEWLALPRRIVARKGCAAGVEFDRARLVGAERSARTSDGSRAATSGGIAVVRGEKFTIPAEMVVRALGQEPLFDLLRAVPGLKITADGRVEVDPQSLRTSIPKLFCGGDARAGAGEEVVNAVQDGKIAAAGIDAFLEAHAK